MWCPIIIVAIPTEFQSQVGRLNAAKSFQFFNQCVSASVVMKGNCWHIPILWAWKLRNVYKGHSAMHICKKCFYKLPLFIHVKYPWMLDERQLALFCGTKAEKIPSWIRQLLQRFLGDFILMYECYCFKYVSVNHLVIVVISFLSFTNSKHFQLFTISSVMELEVITTKFYYLLFVSLWLRSPSHISY